MKRYVFIFFAMLLSLASTAQNSSGFFTVKGNQSSNTPVVLELNFQLNCAVSPDRNRDYDLEIINNIITVTFIADILPSYIICEPPPPGAHNIIEVDLGILESGAYTVNLIFVDADTLVETDGGSYSFSVATSIPTMNLNGLLLLMIAFLVSIYTLQKRLFE